MVIKRCSAIKFWERRKRKRMSNWMRFMVGNRLGSLEGGEKVLFSLCCSHFGVKGFKNGCESVMGDKRVSMNAKHHKDSLGQVWHHYVGVAGSFTDIFFLFLSISLSLCFTPLSLSLSLFECHSSEN